MSSAVSGYQGETFLQSDVAATSASDSHHNACITTSQGSIRPFRDLCSSSRPPYAVVGAAGAEYTPLQAMALVQRMSWREGRDIFRVFQQHASIIEEAFLHDEGITLIGRTFHARRVSSDKRSYPPEMNLYGCPTSEGGPPLRPQMMRRKLSNPWCFRDRSCGRGPES